MAADSQRLRLAVVGCGAIADFHLDGIARDAPRIEVTAAIDPDAARAAHIARRAAELPQGRAAATFPSLSDALAADALDAVDIMVPHDLHEPLALEALAAGKHVLLEKPITNTLAASERLLAAGRDAPVVFMVGENSQYWPDVLEVQRQLDSGAIGELVTVRAAYEDRVDPLWFSGERPWRYDRARTGGGIVIDGGAHWIRPLRMWLGEIEAVVGATARPVARMQGESLAHALLRFRSGMVATLTTFMSAGPLSPAAWFRVVGTAGELVIRGGFAGGVDLYDEQHPDGRELAGAFGYMRSFGPELAEFAAAVLDGTPPTAPPEQALGEMRTALALYRSTESKRWEPVWD